MHSDHVQLTCNLRAASLVFSLHVKLLSHLMKFTKYYSSLVLSVVKREKRCISGPCTANSLVYKRFGCQVSFRLNWLRTVKLRFMSQTFGRFTFGRISPHAYQEAVAQSEPVRSWQQASSNDWADTVIICPSAPQYSRL
jgi:hypothetical protein